MENPPSPERKPRLAGRDETSPAEEPEVSGTTPGISASPPEFEDEPPGGYLLELEVGSSNVVWSVLNLLFAVAVGAIWHAENPMTPASLWWTPSQVLWALLPASCGLLLLVTFYQAACGASGQSTWRLWSSLSLSFAALVVRFGAAYWGGVTFDTG